MQYYVANERCLGIYIGRHFACTLTKRDRDSKTMRASASLRVKARDHYHHGRKKSKASSRYVQVI